jgi:superfamily II DNA or RNA helicase
MSESPHDYGLKHSEWRPHQRETIEWLLNNGSKIKIVEAPTGSGKTATATAISSRHPVISLMRTKNLPLG